VSQPADERLSRALRSLDGLSVGDAWGERFVGPVEEVAERIAARRRPASPWRFTDDTEMALAVTEVLAAHHEIDTSALARAFVRRFVADPERGYGAGTAHLLQQMRRGAFWQEAAGAVFHGEGSCGNGAAMRAAPVGAYFADQPGVIVEQARRAACVTHAHSDGQAGAIAVALAAAHVWNTRGEPVEQAAATFFDAVLVHCPDGPTRQGILAASQLGAQPPAKAAVLLGSGNQLLSSDTVPFALWCACHGLSSFEEALWTTVAGLGDRDTTCAIVGGLVALRSPPPPSWVEARETLRFESAELQRPTGGWRRWLSGWEQVMWRLAAPRRGRHKS
jgi:ADP-ribosylglycohydrolase